MSVYNNIVRQMAWGETNMKAILRVFSFSLCAAFVIFCPPLHQLNLLVQTLAPT
jgi:hypothetical protein